MSQGKPVVRIGDLSNGVPHGPPYPSIQGVPLVLVNGREVVIVTNLWQPETISVSGCKSVFVNNFPIVRIGDKISDSDLANTGSSNVYAGFIGEAPTGPITWEEMPVAWDTQTKTWISLYVLD